LASRPLPFSVRMVIDLRIFDVVSKSSFDADGIFDPRCALIRWSRSTREGMLLGRSTPRVPRSGTRYGDWKDGQSGCASRPTHDPISPKVRIPKLAAQQSNLASVQHLVTGAPEEHRQLCPGAGMGIKERLVEFIFTHARQFPKDLLMHPIKHGAKLGLVGIRLGVGIRDRVRPE